MKKEQIAQIIVDCLKNFNVKEIGFFGSFARDEMTPESDIDVLVQYDRGTTLFDVVKMHQELKEKTGKKIDLISKNAVRADVLQYIKKDLQITYRA